MVHLLSPRHKASGEKDVDTCVPEIVGRLEARHIEALHRLLRTYEHALAPIQLTPEEFVILAEVAARDKGTMAPDELAATLRFDDGTLERHLRTLERDGYLRRPASSASCPDGRVELTARGRARLQLARPLWEHAQNQWETAWGQPGVTTLRDGLTLLASLEVALTFHSKTITS